MNSIKFNYIFSEYKKGMKNFKFDLNNLIDHKFFFMFFLLFSFLLLLNLNNPKMILFLFSMLLLLVIIIEPLIYKRKREQYSQLSYIHLIETLNFFGFDICNIFSLNILLLLSNNNKNDIENHSLWEKVCKPFLKKYCNAVFKILTILIFNFSYSSVLKDIFVYMFLIYIELLFIILVGRIFYYSRIADKYNVYVDFENNISLLLNNIEDY